MGLHSPRRLRQVEEPDDPAASDGGLAQHPAHCHGPYPAVGAVALRVQLCADLPQLCAENQDVACEGAQAMVSMVRQIAAQQRWGRHARVVLASKHAPPEAKPINSMSSPNQRWLRMLP